MSTLAEQVVEQLKTDMDNVYDAGYQKGLKEIGGLDVSKFGIINEVKVTNLVTLDYVNENEHNVEVQLTSDTVTDFSGVEVHVLSTNMFNIDKFISTSQATKNGNDIIISGYAPVSYSKLSECCPYLRVGDIITFSASSFGSYIMFGGTITKPVGKLTVTQAMLDKDTFGFYGIDNVTTTENPIVISDFRININRVYPYEPYTEKTYTANADGTVDGVTSISPTMNIICDGVDISAKYYCVPNVEWHRFWDDYQDNGNRTLYNNMFMGHGWRKETFKPKYDIVPQEANALFQDGWTSQTHIAKDELLNMSDVEKECGIVFDFSKCTRMSNTFRQSIFKSLNNIDLKSVKSNTAYMFYATFSRSAQLTYDMGLRRIERLICYEDTVFSTNTFQLSCLLEYVGFEGVIATSIDLHWSSMLVDESVQKLVECLKDLTGQTTQTVTLHPEVEARMPAEQKAIITSKNWTLAVANA